jgi:hypothetical protein
MNEDKFETMELAVREQAEEQAETNQLLKELTTEVNVLRNEVSGFNEKLNNQNITVNTDTRPIQKIIESAFSNMGLMVEKASSKMRTNFWQLYFQMNGPKWTVILLIALTFLFLTYNFSSLCLKK